MKQRYLYIDATDQVMTSLDKRWQVWTGRSHNKSGWVKMCQDRKIHFRIPETKLVNYSHDKSEWVSSRHDKRQGAWGACSHKIGQFCNYFWLCIKKFNFCRNYQNCTLFRKGVISLFLDIEISILTVFCCFS